MLIKIYFIGKFVPLTWPNKNVGLNKTPFVPGWIISYIQNCTDYQTRYLELKYIHINISSIRKLEMHTYPNHTYDIQNLFAGLPKDGEYMVCISHLYVTDSDRDDKIYFYLKNIIWEDFRAFYRHSFATFW